MVTIRKALQEDAELLTEIGMRAWRKAMTHVGETDAMVINARSAFANFTRSGWLHILVIEKSGVPVGWAAREDFDETITDFWIDPDHERKGYGTLLLASLEEDIRKAGFEEARLETHARNQQAVDFFRARGFSIQWLSIVYNPKIDLDVETVGMHKILIQQEDDTYSPH
ncbi:ribosomal-protein-alanine N-acetyltransferase [Peteryoungia aggregata LMG 23059]|uniref:Ribosomal-protein-alanine N-acetyltransferase n=1 Tax=Peteryoungia aggregata LMG 23059 TaxID=1368425 RepID=A0ABU0G944_9HYPH|nr:GNAT family N-acetyltransferase [Peteryoungia aggregata]MDQ0421598.1 ribosomal-protein-alanine N-acetyltransferase [Peteryoungia aggregata LMG 23059]